MAAVEAAGLSEALAGEGPFTLFAPSDEAFAKLPPGTVESLLADKKRLAAVLSYHVVPRQMMAQEVAETESARTLHGQDLRISTDERGVQVEDARVVTPDILCKNGVIHVIDRVVLPGERS